MGLLKLIRGVFIVDREPPPSPLPEPRCDVVSALWAFDRWLDARFPDCTTCGEEISSSGNLKVVMLNGTEDGPRRYYHEGCAHHDNEGDEAVA